MAHELHDDGFHEIQLSGKQLVFLFMATTVVSIVIFLCGVLVGRGVQNARGLLSSSSSVDAGADKSGDDDAATAPATGEPTPVTGLSYPANLPGRQDEPAAVQPGAAAALSSTPEGPAAAKAAEPAAAPARETPREAAKATAKEPVAEAPKESPKAAAAAVPAPSTTPAPAEDGGFTVQVTALKNRPEADAIAQRLQARGYKAYVVAPSGGVVLYKVRVGVNMQRQEADKVLRRLQNEEKYKPWITR
jgi:cell division septation protein DedD